MGTRRSHTTYLLLLPFAGMGLFLVFYVIATFYYPGGSFSQPDHTGFNWLQNYYCDLLDETAINGAQNTASFYARFALACLCFSMIVIWTQIPKLFPNKSINHLIIQITGIASMLTTLFLRAGMHDSIVRIAGILGFIALVTTFIELFGNRFYKLLLFGIFCFLLVALNFYLYETGTYINSLPVVQKITFISCIGWFLILMVTMAKKLGSVNNTE